MSITKMASSNSGKIEKISLNSDDESVAFIEQYVKKVGDFSSQYGSNMSISYIAYNITGNPSKFPDYGDFPQGFVMRTYGQWWNEDCLKTQDYTPKTNDITASHDFIDLEFETAVFPLRISVYETYNPGSVTAIWAYEDSGQWLKLWNGLPQILPHKPRIFSPPLHFCNFKTKILRIEFNHSLLDYYTELDAVQLIGTTELLLPNPEYQTESLSVVLREIGVTEGILHNQDDFYNLTPDYLRFNEDLKNLKSQITKYCVLRKDKKDDIPKKSCYSIPPIQEAFNSLQQFLQIEFPKLVNDINNPSNDESCGNFSTLPDETILKIFQNLDLESLSRCCVVSRRFNNIARDGHLFTKLNFKQYWHCLNSEALISFIPKCQYLLKLDLSWCGNYNKIKSIDFISFLKNCGSTLTHLKLNCCHFVNDQVIQEISQVCKNLRELSLKNCSSIENNGFAELTNLENLERLELYRTKIETDNLCKIFRKNHNMRILDLSTLSEKVNMDVVASEIANSCKKIESIDFWKCQTMSNEGLKVLSQCKSLKTIDLGWCGISSLGEALKNLLISCRDLEKVFLTAMTGLTDKDLEPLIFCTNLKQLDILGARLVTPDICFRILQNCSKLRLIDLSFCDSITDIKIQEWQKSYPYVSFKRSFQATVLSDI